VGFVDRRDENYGGAMMDIKKESPGADLTNIETLKQIVINKFVEAGLPITKIRAGRLQGKEKGIFIYHPNGMSHQRTVRELVEKRNENEYLYRRYKKSYTVSFISTESIADFENYLSMAIAESKHIRGQEDK